MLGSEFEGDYKDLCYKSLFHSTSEVEVIKIVMIKTQQKLKRVLVFAMYEF